MDAPNNPPVIGIYQDGQAAVLCNAFSLGWTLTELISRVQIVAIERCRTDEPPPDSTLTEPSGNAAGSQPKAMALITDSNASFWLASTWRARFSHIANLHAVAFPNSATAKTLYAPPGPSVLPYLYPPTPDYADIGISGMDPTGAPVLKDFQLYDVTRRAINCLTLLLVNPEESLIKDEIIKSQTRLAWFVEKGALKPGGGGGDAGTVGMDATGAAVLSMWPEPPAEFKLDDTTLQEAIINLSELTVKFLQAWDGYLRENYYASIALKQNETMLVAYEAGRSIASLSWGMSMRTAQAQANNSSVSAVAEDLKKAWQETFDPRAIIHAQHQIAALSTAFEDAYFRLNPTQQRSPDDALLVWPNPDLPNQMVHAVKQSLDYWQRAVAWITNALPPVPVASTVLVPADSNVPVPVASTVPAPPRVPTFTLDLSNQLCVALREQSDVWQSLITGQQGLRAYSVESVTKRILQDALDEVMTKVQDDLQQKGAAARKQAMADAQPFLLLIGVVGLGFTMLLVVLLFLSHQLTPATVATTGTVPIVGLILGTLGLRKSSTQASAQPSVTIINPGASSGANPPASGPGAATGSSNLMGQLAGLAGRLEVALVQAYKDGYQQVRIEFATLNQSVAVAYPLVEYFVITPQMETVTSEFTFVTEIIWSGTDRKAEAGRVVEAAFGPFRVLLGSLGSGATGK